MKKKNEPSVTPDSNRDGIGLETVTQQSNQTILVISPAIIAIVNVPKKYCTKYLLREKYYTNLFF